VKMRVLAPYFALTYPRHSETGRLLNELLFCYVYLLLVDFQTNLTFNSIAITNCNLN
jgi:hypothetical protein